MWALHKTDCSYDTARQTARNRVLQYPIRACGLSAALFRLGLGSGSSCWQGAVMPPSMSTCSQMAIFKHDTHDNSSGITHAADHCDTSSSFSPLGLYQNKFKLLCLLCGSFFILDAMLKYKLPLSTLFLKEIVSFFFKFSLILNESFLSQFFTCMMVRDGQDHALY